ncbi:MAG: di-heme-cytochrome C peroxidase [Pseudomonadota bacterium]
MHAKRIANIFSGTTLVSVGSIMIVASCVGSGPIIRDQPAYQKNYSTPAEVLGVSQDRMLEATQNWTAEIRGKYWHHNQGSLMAPFALATNIERHDSEDRFFSDASIARYRYVPQKPGKFNKHGLPLGFTHGEYDGEEYLGMTCSACHSTVITYKGTGLLLDGAPSQANFQAMFDDLTAAFQMTLDDPAKFKRLAKAMGQDTAVAASNLRKDLAAATQKLSDRQQMNATPSDYGYGRVDAIGEIFNSVASQNLAIPENRADPDAPVNYPHVWGTHQSNLVQWNAFAPNVTKFNNIRILGPLVRNGGEVLGVFGDIDILQPDQYDAKDSNKRNYKNSLKERNLIQIEQWLEQLGPPPWPTEIFGPIDQAKADLGKPIYEANCIGCHEVLESPFQCYEAKVMNVWEDGLQTDPWQANNALRKAKVGRLAGREIRPDEPGKYFPDDPDEKSAVLFMLVHQVMRSVAKDVQDRPISSAFGFMGDVLAELGEERCKVPFVNDKKFLLTDDDQSRGMNGAYKARPLNGIWATAPFLHNGSVPNLRALLDKPENRPGSFVLGGWEYDPTIVGYAPYDGPHAFTYDVSKKGNSNGGHIWGTTLSDADKDALLEYLKTL